MANRFLLERCSAVLALVSLALTVAGNKGCQEDYDLGSQTSGTGTGTPTSTPLGTDTADDGGLITAVPTSTPLVDLTVAPTATTGLQVTVAPTPTTPAVAPGVLEGTKSPGLLQELSALSDDSAAAKAAAAKSGTWLGDAYKKGGATPSAPGVWTDSDGDGFADSLENEQGSDPLDPAVTPEVATTTQMKVRIRPTDPDMDGLSTADELRLGTDPNSLDTDEDGRPDGAEVLSGGNPLSTDDRYIDTDGDGLSDDYERKNGYNSEGLDSDGDGLRDDIEIAIGSDPMKIDTDQDGISDGKEFDLGADPTLPETKPAP